MFSNDSYLKENQLRSDEISGYFPAYVFKDKLFLKYPTYKFSYLSHEFDKEKIGKVLEGLIVDKRHYFEYEDFVWLLDKNGHYKQITYSLLGLRVSLETNNNLMQEISRHLENIGIKGEISPAYYIKSYLIELSEEKFILKKVIV